MLAVRLNCSLSLSLRGETYKNIPKHPSHLLSSPVTVKQLQPEGIMCHRLPGNMAHLFSSALVSWQCSAMHRPWEGSVMVGRAVRGPTPHSEWFPSLTSCPTWATPMVERSSCSLRLQMQGVWVVMLSQWVVCSALSFNVTVTGRSVESEVEKATLETRETGYFLCLTAHKWCMLAQFQAGRLLMFSLMLTSLPAWICSSPGWRPLSQGRLGVTPTPAACPAAFPLCQPQADSAVACSLPLLTGATVLFCSWAGPVLWRWDSPGGWLVQKLQQGGAPRGGPSGRRRCHCGAAAHPAH